MQTEQRVHGAHDLVLTRGIKKDTASSLLDCDDTPSIHSLARRVCSTRGRGPSQNALIECQFPLVLVGLNQGNEIALTGHGGAWRVLKLSCSCECIVFLDSTLMEVRGALVDALKDFLSNLVIGLSACDWPVSIHSPHERCELGDGELMDANITQNANCPPQLVKIIELRLAQWRVEVLIKILQAILPILK
eukprot:364157-Prymnesium_polylepis.2